MKTKMGALEKTTIGKAMKFGYSNARVKAMKQSLLSEKETNTLIEADDVAEVYTLLEKTPYKEDLIAGALKERTMADRIEFATTKNLSRTLKKIVKIVPKDTQGAVIALFQKYELNNIKTILTSKHIGEPKEKIEPIIMESMVLSKGKMNKLLNAKDVKEAVILLSGTQYGAVLEKQAKEYEKAGDITKLLFALDNYYYTKISAVVKNNLGDERIITKMLKAQADIKNISNICRAVKDGISEDKVTGMLIEGGNIGKDRLLKASRAKNVEEAAKNFISNYPLQKAIEEYKKTGSLIPIEMELEKNVARTGLKVLRNSVLSLGAIAGFLFLKEEEINNIRKIVRCKEFNLPNEKIREMTVIV